MGWKGVHCTVCTYSSIDVRSNLNMVISPNRLFPQMVIWKHKQTEAEAVSFVIENHTLPYCDIIVGCIQYSILIILIYLSKREYDVLLSFC